MQDRVEELSTSAPRAGPSTHTQTEPLEDDEDEEDDAAAECMRTAVTHQQTRIPPSTQPPEPPVRVSLVSCVSAGFYTELMS